MPISLGHKAASVKAMAVDIQSLKVEPGAKVDLSLIDTGSTPGWDPADKQGGKTYLKQQNEELAALQELLWAEGKQRVLMVLQAMDTGGKDGTINHVFEGINPSGVRVVSFKKPTDPELARDYLWRVHAHVPADGELVIFNRSHYEDVLVVRVEELVPAQRWQRRYEHITNFEQMLTDEGTTILKFFLHISKDEQRQRLQDRLDEPHKNWKFDPGDLGPRSKWDQYQSAFEELLTKTSTAKAPWYVIPADRKWYRNMAVSAVLIEALQGLGMNYPQAPPDIADIVISE